MNMPVGGWNYNPNNPLNLQIAPISTFDQVQGLSGNDWLGPVTSTNPSLAQGNVPATWNAPTTGAGGTGILGSLGRVGDWMGKNGQTIGNWANVFGQGMQAYLGLKQLSLAKDALKFEKKSFKTNLANQVDSYNTQMKDRITGRYYATEEERQAALKDAELPQGMRG